MKAWGIAPRKKPKIRTERRRCALYQLLVQPVPLTKLDEFDLLNGCQN